MTGDKQREKANQKLTSFYLTGQQHKGQRHQGDNPGIDRQHDPDLCRLHIKTLRDIGEQTDGDKLSGIENKCGNSKRNDP